VKSGTVHPVVFAKEELNVDSVINGGVFLCMKPGYYYFSAAMSPHRSGEKIDVIIVHNSKTNTWQ